MTTLVYHVTPRSNLVKIRQEGLFPTSHPAGSREAGAYLTGVMMYESLEAAQQAIANTNNQRWLVDALVILAVDIEGYYTRGCRYQQLFVETVSPIDQARVNVQCVVMRYKKTNEVDNETAGGIDLGANGELEHVRV